MENTRAPELLKAWLDTEGRKQKWLAKKLLVHEATLSRWLGGHAVPHQVFRTEIAEITDGAVTSDAWGRE